MKSVRKMWNITQFRPRWSLTDSETYKMRPSVDITSKKPSSALSTCLPNSFCCWWWPNLLGSAASTCIAFKLFQSVAPFSANLHMRRKLMVMRITLALSRFLAIASSMGRSFLTWSYSLFSLFRRFRAASAERSLRSWARLKNVSSSRRLSSKVWITKKCVLTVPTCALCQRRDCPFWRLAWPVTSKPLFVVIIGTCVIKWTLCALPVVRCRVLDRLVDRVARIDGRGVVVFSLCCSMWLVTYIDGWSLLSPGPVYVVCVLCSWLGSRSLTTVESVGSLVCDSSQCRRPGRREREGESPRYITWGTKPHIQRPRGSARIIQSQTHPHFSVCQHDDT